MATFFVRTDAGAAGPFTGVELREAALAGLLTPETVISGAPTGPWTPAYEAGLFSDKRIPLPHPTGTAIPSYHVSGLSESFRGPFKLRELIGFAARGLLPADAKLRSDSHPHWIPAVRIRILAATLRGDLALIDRNGKVIRRAAKSTAVATEAAAQAPIMLAKPAVHRPDNALVAERAKTVEPAHSPERHRVTIETPAQASSGTTVAEADASSQMPEPFLHRLRSRIRRPEFVMSPNFAKRVAVVLAVAVAFTTAGYAVTQRKPATLARETVFGDWLIPEAGESECRCGLAFRADGRCVVFNAEGPCWTGRYRWLNRTDDARGLRGIDTTIKLDIPSPHHPVESVGATEGYLRFAGEGDSLPVIDGHPVSDAFVQRTNKQLRLGYLVSIEIGENHKQLHAAWISFDKGMPRIESDESAVGTIENLPKNEELLCRLGIPDEARPIHRYEIPREKIAKVYENAQLIRYGNHRFALTEQAAWQPVGELPTQMKALSGKNPAP